MTVNDPSSSRELEAQARKTDAISLAAIGTPITFCARATRIVTGLRFGSRATRSTVGPGSPPQISRISRVARSMPSTLLAKSTPRSKRCEASLVKL